MHIICIAMNPGHEGALRNGRFFDNGSEISIEVVEVLDQDGKPTGDDPPESIRPGTKTLKHDAVKVGTRSYQAFKRDPRIKVLADGETQGSASAAALDTAKAAVQQATAKATDLEIANADLKAQLAELQAKLQAAESGKGGKK
jgi:hypothetical protein